MTALCISLQMDYQEWESLTDLKQNGTASINHGRNQLISAIQLTPPTAKKQFALEEKTNMHTYQA